MLCANKPGDTEAAAAAFADDPRVRVLSFEDNPGYLPALQRALPHVDTSRPVVLCNCDLVADPGLVPELLRQADAFPDAGWLAPAVIGSLGVDQNPNLLAPPSARWLRALAAVHRVPQVADLLLLRKEGHSSRTVTGVEPGSAVFAGHGSCIVLTPRFFAAGGSCDYPFALFGEERGSHGSARGSVSRCATSPGLWCATPSTLPPGAPAAAPSPRSSTTAYATGPALRRRPAGDGTPSADPAGGLGHRRLAGMSTSETSTDDVWLVVPLFNEEFVIADVVHDARRTFPNVVVVDDGSSDHGADAAASRGCLRGAASDQSRPGCRSPDRARVRAVRAGAVFRHLRRRRAAPDAGLRAT